MPQRKMIVATRGQGLYEFTSEAKAFVSHAGVEEGLLTIFVRHTSCSLLIQENADPDVRRDLTVFFSRLVPPSDDPSMRWIIHTLEGPDDMPAHINRRSPRFPSACRSATAGSCSAPGRAFIFSNTAMSRIGAKSCCISRRDIRIRIEAFRVNLPERLLNIRFC